MRSAAGDYSTTIVSILVTLVFVLLVLCPCLLYTPICIIYLIELKRVITRVFVCFVGLLVFDSFIRTMDDLDYLFN